jgi:hypothetical protein
MEMRLCSELRGLFIGVCSFDDSTELCVTACVMKGGKSVRLDFSFFIDVDDGYLDLIMFDNGCWDVAYIYGCEEKSWFPDVLRVSKTLVFDGSDFRFVK